MKILLDTVTTAMVLIHTQAVNMYIPPYIEPTTIPTPTTDPFPNILTALPTTNVK